MTTPVYDTRSGYAVCSYQEHFCEDCLPDDVGASDASPMDYEEVDYPCHCAECGCLLYHNLTTDGVEYIRGMFASPTWGGENNEWYAQYLSQWPYLKEGE